MENSLPSEIRNGYKKLAKELLDIIMINISSDVPIYLIMDGLMGIGKSTFAKFIINELHDRNRIISNEVIELDYFLYDSHTRDKWEEQVLKEKETDPTKIIDARSNIYQLPTMKSFFNRLGEFLNNELDQNTLKYTIKKAYHRNVKQREHRIQPKQFYFDRHSDLIIVNEYALTILNWMVKLSPFKIRMIGNSVSIKEQFLKRTREIHPEDAKLIKRRLQIYDIEKEAWDRYIKRTANLVQILIDISSENPTKWIVSLVK